MSQEQRDAQNPEEHKVVIKDRRRLDPQTGQIRPSDAGEQPAAEGTAAEEAPGRHAVTEPPAVEVVEEPSVGAELAELKAQLDERTVDLQRLQAEYANYRKRVERDREAVVVAAKAGLVVELLPVLDDVERADAHGDLTGAFKAVADKLVSSLGGAGLQSFGHEGEPFEPSVHEAVQHATSPEVNGPTVTAVLRRGYRFGERVVRPALVAVTDHEPAAPAEDSPAEQPSGGQR